MRINIHKGSGIELLAGVKSLRNILIISLPIAISGCSFLPFPINHALSVAHTMLDIKLVKETSKTSVEHLISEVTKKDCRWARVIDLASVCMTKKEKIDYILSKNCDIITWNWIALPRCREYTNKQ